VAEPESLQRRRFPAPGQWSINAAVAAVRTSGRVRLCALLWRASRPLSFGAAAFVLVEGAVPVAAMIALGRASGSIPAAVQSGLDSPAAHRLWVLLTIGCGLYALSLLRGPVEDLLTAAVRGRVSEMVQQRLVAAVGTPAGIAHLEDPEVLDRLARVRGEVTGYQLADAPMTLAGKVGDRFGGLLACLVICGFRWWLGIGLLVMWLLVRRPLGKMVSARVATFRKSAEPLRASWYYVGLSLQPKAAAELRIFGLGDWLVGRYRDMFLEGMTPAWDKVKALNKRVALMSLLVLAGYGGACALLGWQGFKHEIPLSTLTVMLPMLGMSVPVGVFTLADFSLGLMLSGLPDLDDLESSLTAAGSAALLDTGPAAIPPAEVPPAETSPTAISPTGISPTATSVALRRELRFEGVSFRYPGASTDVLTEVELTLPAGQSTALVGVNGAGKTTLVTLLARLRDPTGGRVTVDGVPLTDLPAREWQRKVAVVFQDYTRYPLTMRGNIAFGLLGEQPDAEALERAADRSGATKLINSLPNGWDTMLSTGYPGGRDLSGGQWQRVALARALYAVECGAQILVLDEPTAQLDVRAEAAFYDRFLEITEGVTTLLISHRFASVRRAHAIAVLSDSRVAEYGSHEELLAADGQYAQMFKLQAARFAGPANRETSQ
jgi:ATP-binding cassette, subfamily B, bacterial